MRKIPTHFINLFNVKHSKKRITNPYSKWFGLQIRTSGGLGNKENSKVKNEFNLYPNPTNNVLYINFESANHKVNTINILNYLGQIVKQIDIKKQETIKIDIEDLPPGFYIIDLIFEGNSKQSKKFVKL